MRIWFPSAVTKRFRDCRERDKSAHGRGCNEEIFSFINPSRGAALCWSGSRGAATCENISDRILIGSSLSANAARIEAFRQGLRELGYVEGKNIVIEIRSAEGKLDRLPELAAELARVKVDVIVTTGPIVNRPVKQATSTDHALSI